MPLLPEIGAQTFYTPLFAVPPPAVFHNKAKRTQQGDLLLQIQPLRLFKQVIWPAMTDMADIQT